MGISHGLLPSRARNEKAHHCDGRMARNSADDFDLGGSLLFFTRTLVDWQDTPLLPGVLLRVSTPRQITQGGTRRTHGCVVLPILDPAVTLDDFVPLREIQHAAGCSELVAQGCLGR